MASSSEKATMISLRSSDNDKVFEVERSITSQMTTIKKMIDDGCAKDTIDLPNISSRTLAKVIEYCKKHAEVEESEMDEVNKMLALMAWDSEFVKVHFNILFDYVLAANYLGHKGLLNLACEAVGNLIRGKTPDEICVFFNIKESTVEGEEEVRRKTESIGISKL